MRITRPWLSGHSNARLETLNSLLSPQGCASSWRIARLFPVQNRFNALNAGDPLGPDVATRSGDVEKTKIMPKHIARLLVLLVLFATIAYGAKQYFTVSSYYLYGHYRGNSVADIASQKPEFMGPAFCASCHVAQSTAWANGVHNSAAAGKVVKCEVCHGPAGRRDVKGPFEIASTGPTHPIGVKMTIPTDTARLCTLCHEQIAGRPVQQPQIVVAEHAGSLQCTTCHDPHSPRTIAGAVVAGETAGDVAAGQATAAVCAACHSAPHTIGPRLVGQNTVYLAEAIAAYKAGTRDNPMMRAVVENMGDADIRNVAAYYSSQSCQAVPSEANAAANKAAAVAANCTVCHGANGIARQPAWPNLAGQSQNYLVGALKSYQDSSRKNPLMSAMAKDLRDTDAATLVAYFAGVGCK